MIVVISGGERLSSRRSLNASESIILISGSPGIMVSVSVSMSVVVSGFVSWSADVYPSTWISGVSSET